MDFNVRQFNGLTGSPAKSVKRCRKNHESAWEKNTKHYRACDYADDDDNDDADDNDDGCDDDKGPARPHNE